jgi:hypothetical protein
MMTFGARWPAMRGSAGHFRAHGGRYLTYLGGCLVFSSGATFFIYSRLGTDPLDTFSLGLPRMCNLGLPTANVPRLAPAGA